MAAFTSPQSYLKNQVRRRSLTIDFAGGAGSVTGGVLTFTTLDEDLNALGPVFGAVTGVGTTSFVGIILGLDDIFPDYDGTKDTISFVLTTESSMTWNENGVGPRVARYKPDFSAIVNDVLCFRGASGTDRSIGTDVLGSSGAVYVNSGVYDARSICGIFSRGGTIGGWTDATPGTRDAPSTCMSRRASATVATQTDAGLPAVGTGDALAVAMFSFVGTKTTTITQGASGITIACGNGSITTRYLHLYYDRGR